MTKKEYLLNIWVGDPKYKRRYYEKAPNRQLTVKPEGVTVG